jgi:hypothetical protein
MRNRLRPSLTDLAEFETNEADRAVEAVAAL